MNHKSGWARRLYKKLLAFYPGAFKEQLAESMEQTFHDLYREKSRTKKGLFSFVVWAFLDTSIGIFREHLLLLSTGEIMQTLLRVPGTSGVISFIIILPLILMEVINRRNLNEAFPTMLFLGLWLNLFAIGLILLPIMQAKWAANHVTTDSVPMQRSNLLTNSKSSLLVSIVLFLIPVMLFALTSLGWAPLERVLHGPNPEQSHALGQLIAAVFISIPVAAGIIAGMPIARTLQSGGSLFAHPLHLIIVIVILFLFTTSVVGLIMDQWTCFMGVPVCD